MPLDMPFQLGPFTVDEQGGVTPPADRDARFSVRWRGCLVRAAMRPLEAGGGVALGLQAVLGRVPSSASASEAERDAVLAALREVAEHRPAGLRFALSADHQALLNTEAEIALPVTARVLVAQVTRFLLEVAPYLDFAGEAGVTPAGKVKT